MLAGGALLLVPLGVGFWALPPAARLLRRVSDRYRDRAARWSGRPLSPPDPLPHDTHLGPPQQSAILGDDGFWRDLRWAWLEPWTGGLLAAVPLGLAEYGVFGALVQPWVWRRLGEGNWYAFVPVTTTATMVSALLLGLVLLAAGLRLAPAATTLHARLTHRLLSAPRATELARRVARLAATRSTALDVHAAELTRIERDHRDQQGPLCRSAPGQA
ncbi:sensor domain-containing protein [Streptomyces sp. NA02950]|nr:sensor domain-containing protein [Streptomyces sp. NA02950]